MLLSSVLFSHRERNRLLYVLNSPWLSLIDLVKNYPDHELVYCDSKTSQNEIYFDIFNKTKKCYIFLRAKKENIGMIKQLCSSYRESKDNHVILWNPVRSLSSVVAENYTIEPLNREVKVLKKNVSSNLKNRINKTKVKLEDGAVDVFSDIMGSFDYQYELDVDLIELRYRALLLRCIGKKEILTNDVYESLGDDVFSSDSAFFALYSKGNSDLFFYSLKEKLQNKVGYERDQFMSKIINYFEHEVRLRLIVSSMFNEGDTCDTVVNRILELKKKGTSRSTYSKNQIKYFYSKISSVDGLFVKKENQLKLLAINSCRRIARSNTIFSLKEMYVTFLIMYLTDMISFVNFHKVVSRLRVR